MQDKPNYYGILPANVRYDRDLTGDEKVLYSEITALSNKEGYCWATNSFFAELYGKDERTIRRWIHNLTEKSYIKVELIYKQDCKEVEIRKIYIIPLRTEMSPPPDTAVPTPPDKNVLYNNTSINNTSINKDTITFKDFWEAYPKKIETVRNIAYQEWLEISPDKKLSETILKSVDEYKKSPDWKKENGRWIPKPDKFLKERQWERIIKDMPKVEIIDEQKRQRKEACLKQRMAILATKYKKGHLSEISAKRYLSGRSRLGWTDDELGITK